MAGGSKNKRVTKPKNRASLPASPPELRPRRRYAPSEATIQKILLAAERVLIDDGYHALSTRRVAAEAGVSLGHLTYYFPTKHELTRAMITAVMTRYAEQLRSVPDTLQTRPGGDARELIVWLLRDTISKETSGLFPELWVMAKHDPFVASEVRRFYAGVIESFADILQESHPGADRHELLRLGYFVGMLTEGGTVLFANRGERPVTYEQMIDFIVELYADRVQHILRRPR